MANAKKCDRCGGYYDTNKGHIKNVGNERYYYCGVCTRTTGGHRLDEKDLCDECFTEFKRFINGEATKSVR